MDDQKLKIILNRLEVSTLVSKSIRTFRTVDSQSQNDARSKIVQRMVIQYIVWRNPFYEWDLNANRSHLICTVNSHMYIFMCGPWDKEFEPIRYVDTLCMYVLRHSTAPLIDLMNDIMHGSYVCVSVCPTNTQFTVNEFTRTYFSLFISSSVLLNFRCRHNTTNAEWFVS